MRDLFKYFFGWKEVARLQDELRQLKMARLDDYLRSAPVEKVVKKTTVLVAGFDSTDDEPTDPLARQEYVKNVDFFMDAVLNTKLKCSIADIREMLSNIGVAQGLPQNMQRNEYDFFLRGMEAFAWKMHEWATRLQGERRSQLQDKENS